MLFLNVSDPHDLANVFSHYFVRKVQSWPKILAPLYFFQITHNFLEKLFEIDKSILSHPSTGHSPRRILVCSGVFCQTPVGLSYVSLSAVESWVSNHRTPFHLVGDGWCELKLSYLVSEGQLESVWQLIEVVSPPFEHSFAAIFDQVFSCGHIQGG